MKSVLSFPNRGHWGGPSWRGNTSGYIIKELIEHFNPRLFVDACEGSGTSGDVCRELGIEYVGLDLHKGNDFTKDYILHQLPRPADIVFSHPPYHQMITYSGKIYGDEPIDGDTSRCSTSEEFIAKSQVMLFNQREATRDGGIYSTLIGDMRKNGIFESYQSDFIKMMPKEELISVTIKLQHNCLSNDKKYNGSFIPILHEYLLVWEKRHKTLIQISFDVANELKDRVSTTWRNAIRIVMMKVGEADLNTIYKEVSIVANHLLKNNENWKAKVRQQLQKHHTNVKRGVWAA